MGTLTVDGVVTTNPFKVQVLDGNRATPQTADLAALYVYAPGADPATASPLCQLQTAEAGNWMKIQ